MSTALVILALLLMGFRRDVMVAMLGLFIFGATQVKSRRCPLRYLKTFWFY